MKKLSLLAVFFVFSLTATASLKSDVVYLERAASELGIMYIHKDMNQKGKQPSLKKRLAVIESILRGNEITLKGESLREKLEEAEAYVADIKEGMINAGVLTDWPKVEAKGTSLRERLEALAKEAAVIQAHREATHLETPRLGDHPSETRSLRKRIESLEARFKKLGIKVPKSKNHHRARVEALFEALESVQTKPAADDSVSPDEETTH